ncbi:hypothetical protein CDL12_10183 [Handroanthus impetiginosus]|uniref:ZF-HD dimerization-type domain-containing protein n=1 Tax=Handroanthus impetiginosus TaxID=429701 RepID=A0A2G9HHY8_9LAMI|nr:hypothetical protein CDL12_10183 [Handroanthus impetiginosus]
MDLELATPIPTPTPESPNENEVDTPPHRHTQPIKPLSFTNGVFKNHYQHPPPPAAVVVYKECMRNHAATLGGHAVDGCGEYMPSPTTAPTDPTSLKCAACGCHRNFHRREPDFPTAITPPFLDFRHPVVPKRSSSSPSPPPPPPAPFPYAPHTLLALSSAVAAEEHHQEPATPTVENPLGRKRFRTKFSQEQKDKMLCFSEKIGWKIQRSNEADVAEFCHEIGVSKGVLKVWMHNNKNTFCKKEIINKHEEIRETNNGGGVHNFHGSNNGSSSSLSP